MSALINWAIYGVGAFYLLFITVIVRRAFQPSCRNCMFYQDCLDDQLLYAASGGKMLPRQIHCSREIDND